MEKVIKYIAKNGNEFDSEKECRDYEARIDRQTGAYVSNIPEFMSPMDMVRDPELAERYRKTKSRWG